MLEWSGWIAWMKRMFSDGTLKEHWKNPDMKNAFDPEFQNFIDNEIVV